MLVLSLIRTCHCLRVFVYWLRRSAEGFSACEFVFANQDPSSGSEAVLDLGAVVLPST
jgi:hypothetical protein